MEFIKLNENIDFMMDSYITEKNTCSYLEIIGIRVNNKTYTKNELREKCSSEIKIIAYTQVLEFISANRTNTDFFNNNDNISHLVNYEAKPKELYPNFYYNNLKEKNTIIIKTDHNIIQWNILTNEYYIEKSKYNESKNFDPKDLILTIYDYSDLYSMLLNEQLELKTAHPVFVKYKKINEFLKGKKSIKVIANNDKELTIKDITRCNLLYIENMKIIAGHTLNDIKDLKKLVFKHGKKAIEFSLDNSIDDVKAI